MSLNTLKSRHLGMVVALLVAGFCVSDIAMKTLLTHKHPASVHYGNPLGIGQSVQYKFDGVGAQVGTGLASTPDSSRGPADITTYCLYPNEKQLSAYQQVGSLEKIVGPGMGRFPLDGLAGCRF